MIGMDYNAVMEDLQKTKHIRFRVVAIDDQAMMLTCDFDPLRINLILKDGIVTDYSMG